MRPHRSSWSAEAHPLPQRSLSSWFERSFLRPGFLPSDAMAVGPECRSVVKVYCEGAAPSYVMPWQLAEQEAWTGTGFDVAMPGAKGGFILTNAHVIEHAFVIRIARQHSSSKKAAKVVCIAHDLDLALIQVDGAKTEPLLLTVTTPAFFSAVTVLG